MKKILVTGAEGFIGSHLTEFLVKAGYHVRAFVLYNSFGQQGWLDSFDYSIRREFDVFVGDLRDPYGVRKSLEGCDVVLNLAALIAIPYSYHSPETYVDTNLKGTLNVLQASRDLGLTRVIHTSTSEVYGTAQFVPITESHPLQAQSPYAATKIAADQMALSFYRSFGTPVTVIRPFNTYGPRQSNRAVIPTIISQLAAGKERVKLGSVSPTRDFNYVQDIVRGFAAAVDAPRLEGQVINLASQFEISISDTAKLIGELMSRAVVIEEQGERVRPAKSEVERLFGDNSRARELLGWAPEYGGVEGFRQGLAETINWFTDESNLRHYKVDQYVL